MKKLFLTMLVLLIGFSCSTESLQTEAELTEANAKFNNKKPVKGIYLDGNTISELSVVQVDKGQPSRIFWDANIAIGQQISAYQLQDDGTYKYKYHTSTNGTEGFYISYSDPKIKEPRNRLFLDKGDIIKLYFHFDEEFTQPIQL
jgi:hypothetical protein